MDTIYVDDDGSDIERMEPFIQRAWSTTISRYIAMLKMAMNPSEFNACYMERKGLKLWARINKYTYEDVREAAVQGDPVACLDVGVRLAVGLECAENAALAAAFWRRVIDDESSSQEHKGIAYALLCYQIYSDLSPHADREELIPAFKFAEIGLSIDGDRKAFSDLSKRYAARMNEFCEQLLFWTVYQDNFSELLFHQNLRMMARRDNRLIDRPAFPGAKNCSNPSCTRREQNPDERFPLCGGSCAASDKPAYCSTTCQVADWREHKRAAKCTRSGRSNSADVPGTPIKTDAEVAKQLAAQKSAEMAAQLIAEADADAAKSAASAKRAKSKKSRQKSRQERASIPETLAMSVTPSSSPFEDQEASVKAADLSESKFKSIMSSNVANPEDSAHAPTTEDKMIGPGGLQLEAEASPNSKQMIQNGPTLPAENEILRDSHVAKTNNVQPSQQSVQIIESATNRTQDQTQSWTTIEKRHKGSNSKTVPARRHPPSNLSRQNPKLSGLQHESQQARNSNEQSNTAIQDNQVNHSRSTSSERSSGSLASPSSSSQTSFSSRNSDVSSSTSVDWPSLPESVQTKRQGSQQTITFGSLAFEIDDRGMATYENGGMEMRSVVQSEKTADPDLTPEKPARLLHSEEAYTQEDVFGDDDDDDEYEEEARCKSTFAAEFHQVPHASFSKPDVFQEIRQNWERVKRRTQSTSIF